MENPMLAILTRWADVFREAQENFDRLPESHKQVYRREIDASIKRRMEGDG